MNKNNTTPDYSVITPTDVLAIRAEGEEVIKITPEGDIYWRGREVETDDDFKGAMMELAGRLIQR